MEIKTYECSWSAQQPDGKLVFGEIVITRSRGKSLFIQLASINRRRATLSPLLLFAILDYVIPLGCLKQAKLAQWFRAFHLPHPRVIYRKESLMGDFLEHEYCIYCHDFRLKRFYKIQTLSIDAKSGEIYFNVLENGADLLSFDNLLPLLAAVISDYRPKPCKVRLFSDGLTPKTLSLPEDVPIFDIIRGFRAPNAGQFPKLFSMLEKQLEAEEALICLAK